MKIVKKSGSLVSSKPMAASVALTLPTEPSTPLDRVGDYSILLYGEKKIGKTSLASQFEGAFFMMCEPGGKALRIYQRSVPDWKSFKQYVALIAKDKKFKTVVIDTVDLAYKYCTDYICQKLVISHLSEEDWGRGWEAARDEFTSQINTLLHTGKGVIFISHSAEKEIKTRAGEKYDKILPTMSNQARAVLEGIVDIWVYYGYSNASRVLTVQGNDHVGAGHRLETRFKYTDGSAILEIPMGNSPKEAYQNFMKGFNNQLVRTYKRKES